MQTSTIALISQKTMSKTHRDVACPVRSPEHKYPLAPWDISSADPPGLAQKWLRGCLVIIRANPNPIQPPALSRANPWDACSHWSVLKSNQLLSVVKDFIFKYVTQRVKTQLYSAEQMWDQTSYVVVVFQEAPPLVPKALPLLLSLSFFLSTPPQLWNHMAMRGHSTPSPSGCLD